VIAITFALPAESSKFVGRVREKKRETSGDSQLITGKIDNRPIAVFHTGVGEKICRRRIAQFLQDRQFDLLISAGFAGALTNAFDVGDLLLAKNFSTVELDRVRAILSHFHVQTGDLFTASRVLDSHEERIRAAEKTGALAIDMETEFIARACAEYAVPLLSLRVISDTPARPLPAPPEVLFDIHYQKTKLLHLSVHLLKHPAALPRLVSFAQQVRSARRSLTGALEMLLRSDFAAPVIS
jgi:adenosylhomocysteine nucleosidase